MSESAGKRLLGRESKGNLFISLSLILELRAESYAKNRWDCGGDGRGEGYSRAP